MKVFIKNHSLLNRKSTQNIACDLSKYSFDNKKFSRRHDRSTLILFCMLSDLISEKDIRCPKSIILESYNTAFKSLVKYSSELKEGGYLKTNPIDFINMSDNTALGYAAQEFSLSNVVQLVSNNGLEYAFQLLKERDVASIISAGMDEAIKSSNVSEGGAAFTLTNEKSRKEKSNVELINVNTSNNFTEQNIGDIESFLLEFIQASKINLEFVVETIGNINTLDKNLENISNIFFKLIKKYCKRVDVYSNITGQTRAASIYQNISILLDRKIAVNSTGIYLVFNINQDSSITLVSLRIG